jgi:hypothetical protein
MFCIYIAVFSPYLTEAPIYDDTRLADLEDKLIASLANSSSNRARIVKNSFNFLLLDPRITPKMKELG